MFEELKQCRLFAEFDDSELKRIQNICEKSSFKPGACAFHEGDPGDSLIIIRLGTIRLTKKTASGEEEVLTMLGSGAYVGEMALFDKSRRSATGTPIENTEILRIPYDSLQKLLDAHIAMAAKFYKALAMGISRRLNFMNEDFATLKTFLKSRQ